MQFDVSADDGTETTEPVAPGTSCWDPCPDGVGTNYDCPGPGV